jgi:ethanolamine utilization protein EutN
VEIGRVVGQVVATVKQAGLQGRTLLLIVPLDLADVDEDGPEEATYVAADYVGAGTGEVVLVSRGSAARVDDATTGVPTDAAAVAIVDSVVVNNKTVFRKSG